MILNKITYFYPEKPVLMMIEADSFDQMSNDEEWVCEPKYNGSRCLVHLLDGKVEFWDRHGKHLKYNNDPLHDEGRKKIVAELIRIFGDKGYFVLDSELRHNKVTGIQNKLVIYDIHVFENEVLNKILFDYRRRLLENKIREAGVDNYRQNAVHLIYQFPISFKKVFDDYVGGKYGDPDEFEGIVIKNLNGKLKLGRASGTDSMWMLKVRKQTGRHRY